MFFVVDFASLCFFFSNLICCLYMSQDLRLKKRGYCLLPATQSPFFSKDTTGEKKNNEQKYNIYTRDVYPLVLER